MSEEKSVRMTQITTRTQMNNVKKLFTNVPGSFLNGRVDNAEQFIVKLKSECSEILHSGAKSTVNSKLVLKDQSLLPIPTHDLKNYPHISKLCNIVNETKICIGEVNACVVNYYPPGIAHKNAHADDESYLDNKNTSICNFSIGSSRKIHIYVNNDVTNPAFSFEQSDNSMLFMHPGSQDQTKHRVSGGQYDRWSISFRRVLKTEHVSESEWPYLSPIKHKPVSLNIQNLKMLADKEMRKSDITHNYPTDTCSSSINQFAYLLDKSDLQMCKQYLTMVENRISELKKPTSIQDNEVDELVTHIPNFLEDVSTSTVLKSTTDNSDYVNLDLIREEIKPLNLENSKIKVSTQWVIKNPSEVPFLKGKLMSDFPVIEKLLNTVNEHEKTVGELNSCLISFYPSEATDSRLHADDNAYICSNSSISNVSFGDPRKISFFSRMSHSSPPIKSYSLQNKSLLVMQPSCQQKLNHLVYPSKGTDGGSYCFSFRKVQSLDNCSRNTDIKPSKQITVLLGTSITKKIKPHKLAGKKSDQLEVINSSDSGHKINDIGIKLDQLYAGTLPEIADRPDKLDLNIKNIIISVGTNDVRFKENGVHCLYIPMYNLVTKARRLFPDAKIFVQSCLPILIEKSYTVRNVNDFNTILRRCCKSTKECYYFDAFSYFLDRSPNKYPRICYYRDNVHLSDTGLGVLARELIKIVRGTHYEMRS